MQRNPEARKETDFIVLITKNGFVIRPFYAPTSSETHVAREPSELAAVFSQLRATCYPPLSHNVVQNSAVAELPLRLPEDCQQKET